MPVVAFKDRHRKATRKCGLKKIPVLKGESGNPRGRPKATPERRLEARARREVHRQVGNIVVEARKYSDLAVDTLVAIAKDGQTDSSRLNAAVELLNRGYGRPAQSLDLHLSADTITKRLSDMTDAELAALEQRMIAAAPIVLEATAGVSDDAGELPDGDVEVSPPDAPA
jgi:hypothetical protein